MSSTPGGCSALGLRLVVGLKQADLAVQNTEGLNQEGFLVLNSPRAG